MQNDDVIASASTSASTSLHHKSYDMANEEENDHRVKIVGDPLFADTRALILTCKFLNLSYKFIPVDTLKGEHRSAQFLKAHPCGHLPILVDGN